MAGSRSGAGGDQERPAALSNVAVDDELVDAALRQRGDDGAVERALAAVGRPEIVGVVVVPSLSARTEQRRDRIERLRGDAQSHDRSRVTFANTLAAAIE